MLYSALAFLVAAMISAFIAFSGTVRGEAGIAEVAFGISLLLAMVFGLLDLLFPTPPRKLHR